MVIHHSDIDAVVGMVEQDGGIAVLVSLGDIMDKLGTHRHFLPVKAFLLLCLSSKGHHKHQQYC